MTEESTIETESDVSEPMKVVKRWKSEMKLADKRDKQWVRDAKEAISIYRNQNYQSAEMHERKEMFNIFWANVETKRSNLYENTPRPDIRRRFKEKNILAASISELLERASSFTFENSELDYFMTQAVEDMLVPGRGVTRVKYAPTFTETEEPEDSGSILEEMLQGNEKLDYEEIQYEQVQWDKFKIGPCSNWYECPWIAFIHDLTKDECEEKWGEEMASNFSYSGDETDPTLEEDKQKDSDDTVWKTTTVWEIWVKKTRQVIWIAPSYNAKPIEEQDDPLNLAEFWPIPRPLYAIRCSTSMTPQTEHSMYETLQKELETATKRLKNIMKGLKVRGVYDSRIADLDRLMEEDDNGFIPSTQAEPLLEHGLDKGIWMLPIDRIIEIVIALRQFREDLMQQIYEITGISDIVRGSSNPHETLGAQRIKAQFGGKRFREQQKEVQRYARDLLRLTVELVADFDPETLTLITGLEFPSEQEKMMAQMQQQQGMVQEQDMPRIQNILQTPSWEEITNTMTSDLRREYLVDIETNSTIEIDESEDRENIQQLFTAIVQFMQAAKQAPFTQEVNNALLGSIVRRFKFGREVEDALENMVNNPQPDPGAAEAEMEQQLKQMDMQMKQMDVQTAQIKAEAEQAKAQAELMKSQQEMQSIQLDMAFENQKHQQRMAELAMPSPTRQ